MILKFTSVPDDEVHYMNSDHVIDVIVEREGVMRVVSGEAGSIRFCVANEDKARVLRDWQLCCDPTLEGD